MLLKEYETIFHLYTIFNFAYVASNNFLQTLESTIFRSFVTISEWLKELDDKIVITKESLFQLNPTVAGVNTEPELEVLKSNLNSIESDFSSTKIGIYSSKERIYSTSNFVELCLFGALYSLTILVVCVFHEKEDKNLLNESLAIFNYLSILLLFYILILQPIFNTRQIGSRRMIFIYFLIVALLIPFYNYNKWVFPNEEKINRFIITSSLIIPIAHFIAYFIRSYIIASFLELSVRRQVRRYSNRMNSFDQQLNKYKENTVFLAGVMSRPRGQ
jgi:hypothetical protein